MNLEKLNDQDLLTLSKEKVQAERNLTIEVIELLQEIYKRRLHLKRGYSSLHEYCVKELKYSDGAAFRRIKTMKLVEEMPEIKKTIETGALSLSTASQLQKAFESKGVQKKPFNIEMKQSLLAQVENQSRRQTEIIIAQISPEVISKPEKVTFINATQVRLELVIDQELFEKLERLKNLTSHKNKNLRVLLHQLVDQELQRKDPMLKAASTKGGASPAPVSRVNSRYIPACVKQEVWMRDKGRCTYFDSKTKKTCESNHRLQFEHIEPYSFGGKGTVQNLRLLCANHNQLTAQKVSRWTQQSREEKIFENSWNRSRKPNCGFWSGGDSKWLDHLYRTRCDSTQAQNGFSRTP